ncbi:hypothetical protein FRB98_004801 [Tulasnella sp. 332]|nr:hypothetical protein FRB98_004801 [Tulasnella sp. 332]
MLQLPPELTVATLKRATLIDILRCKRVCKTLNTIINGSTVLQYLIELGCAGYTDGRYGKGALPPHERLRRLVETESAWRRLALQTKMKFKLPSAAPIATTYEFSGGVFIRGSGETSLEVVRFPSTFGDTTFEVRTLTQSQLAVKVIRDMAIDPGSDLLILVEKRVDPGDQDTFTTYDFHIRSLNTCLPHAAAQQSLVTHRIPRRLAYAAATTIVGDLLSVMFSSRLLDNNKSGELVIWNWKTCNKIATLEGAFPYPITCTFLSPSVFMIPQTRRTSSSPTIVEGYLAIYVITSSDQGEPVTPRLLAQYNMPAFSPKVTECAMICRSDPAPCPQHFPSSGNSATVVGDKTAHQAGVPKPFYADPLKRIFVIGMRLVYRKKRLMGADRELTEEFTVFLHSDAFVNLLGEETVWTGQPSLTTFKEFEWAEYCQYTRLTELKLRTNFVCFAHGQRYLDYEEHPYGNRIHIWEFNQCIIRRRKFLVQNLQKEDKPKKEIFNEGVMQWNTVSDGGETAHYSAPANDDRYTPNIRSPTENRPTGSAANKYALNPEYDSEPAFIENTVFKEKKVWSSLPFRRITSRSKFANLSGAMMDDERVVLVKREEGGLEIMAMSIVQNPPIKINSDAEPDLSGLLYHLTDDSYFLPKKLASLFSDIRCKMALPSKWALFAERSVRLTRDNVAAVLRMNPVYHDSGTKELFGFRTPADIAQYVVGSDADIGGYSTAKLELDPTGHGKFLGELRTDVKPELRGKMKSGYAGFRSKKRPSLFGEMTDDLSEYRYLTLQVRAKGDPMTHKEFYVNIQTDGPIESDVWQHRLQFEGNGEWEQVKVPISNFFLTNSGGIVNTKMTMAAESIRTIGVSLLGGKALSGGRFQLEIESIGATNEAGGLVVERAL